MTGKASERFRRVIITTVEPSVDGGRWPVRRSAGQSVEFLAGVIADGHDKLRVVLHIEDPDGKMNTLPLQLRWNDEYVGVFTCEKPGRYRYQVHAWVDRFATWQDEFRRRVEHGASRQERQVELQSGTALVHEAAEAAPRVKRLKTYARAMEKGNETTALKSALLGLMQKHDVRQGAVQSDWFTIEVDPPLATCAAWYEFFPRSASSEPGKHGTLDDAASRLDRIKAMGFDVVYLPPVHPIGDTFRKGKDNAPEAAPDEPGSPWAIGNVDGGHCSVHAELGGLEAFDRFVARAKELELHVALDIAFQCSPDHPYVKEHPEWFKHRSDGSIRYAENPPKKYQDVYPLDFTCTDYLALWEELKRVFEFWIDRGVKVFRVDNPHTKTFPFWEWCLASLRDQDPSLIFLAEAFTAPKTMYTLAKLGFNNSYTYFTWRNTKDELRSYVEELAHTEVAEYFRPNFWPNTPDILHDYLVTGGRAAHITRFVLAATLSPTYGVYGPPYEHVRNRQHPEREEYADNEKYEIRTWDWEDEDSLQPLFAKVNLARKAHAALRQLRGVKFFDVHNDQILGYCKRDGDSKVICFVSLDPFHEQHGDVELPLECLGLESDQPFALESLLGSDRFTWQGSWQRIGLNPDIMPAALYSVTPETDEA